jgi:sugar/nucleoside kinase (ribokinase family)
MGLITKRLETSVEELVKKGIICITTLGSAGVLYQDRGQTVRVSGFKSTKELDPTGAGDTFRAGFITGLIEGKELPEALKQGNALASFTIESYGTTNHKPTKKQIAERMKMLKIM